MTLPQARFVGDDGEVSAWHRPADQAPELTCPTGDTVHCLATGAATNGEFGLYRWRWGRSPSGSDPSRRGASWD